jgi:hypothetical protein
MPLLAGMGSDTSDSTIELYESWKNDPNRDMNTVAILNINFNLNKLVPLFTKMRNSINVYQSMLERMANPAFKHLFGIRAMFIKVPLSSFII